MGREEGAFGATIRKSIFKCVFKCKIIKKKFLQICSTKKSSNLHTSFVFKCRNEFHIMSLPPGIGWNNNEEIYFCRCLNGKNWPI
jgi:hypothetical protein